MVFDNTFCRVMMHIGKWVVGSAMRTYDKNDAHDPYEYKEDPMGENVIIGNVETESNGRRFKDTPLDFATTMRSLRVEIHIYKGENERMIKVQEE